jgi:gas vesicle protein/cation transport regulator ChaB
MAARQDINDLLENIRAELPTRAHDLFEEAVQRASEGERRGRKRVEREIRDRSPWERQRRHYQEEEGILAIFALVIGFIGGVAFMYLFDPERGARRRVLLGAQAERVVEDASNRVRSEVSKVADEASDTIKDTSSQVRSEVSKVANEAVDTLKDTTSQVSGQVNKTASSVSETVNKAATNVSSSLKDATKDATAQVNKAVSNVSEGVNKAASDASDSLKQAGNQVKSTAAEVKSEVKQKVEGASLSDTTLLVRVRAEVARDVTSPVAIEVAVKDGVVTLTGKVRAGEVQALVEKLTALPGVRSVDNRLEIHDAIENTPNSNGVTP